MVVVDSNKGTTTDINGQYSIAVPKGGILEFTYIGMSSQRITCGGGISNLDVTMKEDAARLDEVRHPRLRLAARADVTRPCRRSTVRNFRRCRCPISRRDWPAVCRVLSPCRIPDSRSGPSQHDHSRREVGYSYIVDGVQRSINDIDPNDVESVSLLKDGAAVAVYGLEAAGGVMIVTTKKGRQVR